MPNYHYLTENQKTSFRTNNGKIRLTRISDGASWEGYKTGETTGGIYFMSMDYILGAESEWFSNGHIRVEKV
jgi:hypothetical protein